jgi:hypothetical protein
MSTKIDDLPGPIPDDVQNDINELQGELSNEHMYRTQPNQSNIQANVRKRVTFADEVDSHTVTSIKSEFTEENLLLIAILVFSSLPSTNLYVKQLPFVGVYATSDLMTGVLKAIALLILFVLLKIYVLPKFKL